MIVPVIALIEIDTKKYPDYSQQLPSIIMERLSVDKAIVYKFDKSANTDLIMHKLENGKTLPIISYYGIERK